MKVLLIISLFFLMLLSGCGSSQSKFRDFIPGTYTRYSQSEFGESYDTIVITLKNESAREYKIINRWRYDRVLDGKPIASEFKVKESSGIFYPEHHFLQESQTLMLFTFDTKKNLMYCGTGSFTKIK